MQFASPLRSRALAILAASSILALSAGCSGANGTDEASSGASVEELSEDGFVDEDADGADLDGLGTDQETMISEAEAQAEEDLPDPVAQANAEREWDELNMLDGDDLTAGLGTAASSAPGSSAAAAPTTASTQAPAKPPAVKCKKRIHVTFAVYTYLDRKGLLTNGCWVPEATVQDPAWRGCHIGGPDHHVNGPFFFYDDTNPYNPIDKERRGVRLCSHGEKRGYEYMAFREGLWRIVRANHTAAYYAELYADDQHVDTFWYASGVYRHNPQLRGNRRVAPMLNIAPHPNYVSQRTIGTEVLKVCKAVRNHGFLGLYGPAQHEIKGERLRTLVRALNKCTRKS